MTRPTVKSRLRHLWKRLEWNPWFGGISAFLVMVALGLGSTRSLLAGAILGSLMASHVLIWRWACAHVKTEWRLRLINAVAHVVVATCGLELFRWMDHQSSFLGLLIMFAIMAIIYGPMKYFDDISYPPDRDGG